MLMVLKWLASLLCAAGILCIALEILIKKIDDHFVLSHPLFLPLYSAGILQWLLWGVRTGDLALIVPTALQLVFLILLLKKWWSIRLHGINS